MGGDRKQWLPLSLQGGWLQESAWEGHSFFLAGMNRRTEFRLENGPMSQAGYLEVEFGSCDYGDGMILGYDT